MFCCSYVFSTLIKYDKNPALAKILPFFHDDYKLSNYSLNIFVHQNVVDRIKYFEVEVEELNRTDFDLSKIEGTKNIHEAKKEFLNAMDFLKNHNYRKALESVNNAICLSTDHFTNECYLLRCEILFKANLFEDCRSNLSLVVGELSKKHNNILGSMQSKLYKCFEEDEWILPKPLKPTLVRCIQPKFHCEPHPNVPFIDKCLELNYDEYGVVNGVRCNSDLKAGDILVIEDQLCPVLFNDKRYSRCEHCFSDKLSVLIACTKCTWTMFCNVDCFEKAWESYHKYECPIMKMLNLMHPFRTIIRLLITSFKSSEDIDDFIDFTNEPKCKTWNAFTIDWSNLPYNHLPKIIYTLNTCESKLSTPQKLLCTRLTAFFIYLVRTKTALVQDRFSTPKRLNFLREITYRLFLICSNNLYLHQINSIYRFQSENQSFTKTILAIRLFHSFFQHSCKANVASSSYGLDKSIIYTRRPVKRGNRLYINFMQDLPQRIRKDLLKSQLNHECNCFSDENNIQFPCEKSFHVTSDNSLAFLLKEIDKLYLLHAEDVMNLLNLANEYLTDHEHEYPSYELFMHYNAVILCLQRLYGVPILQDVGSELHYELYNLQWARSCEMLRQTVNLYRETYGGHGRNIKQIRGQIFDYLAKSLPLQNDVYKLPPSFEAFADTRYERPIINSTIPLMQKVLELDMVLPIMRFPMGIIFKPVEEAEARTFLQTNCSEMGFEFVEKEKKEKMKKPSSKNKFKRRLH